MKKRDRSKSNHELVNQNFHNVTGRENSSSYLTEGPWGWKVKGAHGEGRGQQGGDGEEPQP